MIFVDPTTARQLIEAVIASFSVLGGGMAYLSGSYAAAALTARQSAEVLARRTNEGIGEGFVLFRSIAVLTFVIMAST